MRVLEAVPRVEVSPVSLLVLPIYGPGSGVAYVDEALYAEWARASAMAFACASWGGRRRWRSALGPTSPGGSAFWRRT